MGTDRGQSGSCTVGRECWPVQGWLWAAIEMITKREAIGSLMTRPLVTGSGGRGWKSRGNFRLSPKVREFEQQD